MSDEPYLWRYRSPENCLTDMDMAILPNGRKAHKPDEQNMTIITWDIEDNKSDDTPTFEGQVVFQGDYEEL